MASPVCRQALVKREFKVPSSLIKHSEHQNYSEHISQVSVIAYECNGMADDMAVQGEEHPEAADLVLLSYRV